MLHYCGLHFDRLCLIKIQSLGSKSRAHINMQKQMQIWERSCWLTQVIRGWWFLSVHLFPVLDFIFDRIAGLDSGLSTVFSRGIPCIGAEYASNQIQHSFFPLCLGLCSSGVSPFPQIALKLRFTISKVLLNFGTLSC